MDDRQIISEILGGNDNSYRLLVDKYKNMVFTIARRVTQNREDAEEAAQDAFLNAYKSLRRYNPEYNFSTWLYKIAYNAAVSIARKKKKNHFSYEQGEDGAIMELGESSIEELIIAGEEKESIRKSIDELGPPDSVIISLFYGEDKTVAEIAKILSYSVSNIKVRLHRSRKKLAEKLSGLVEAGHE
jgi:RNA polymerase sigma factor (sigma-70 family)